MRAGVKTALAPPAAPAVRGTSAATPGCGGNGHRPVGATAGRSHGGNRSPAAPRRAWRASSRCPGRGQCRSRARARPPAPAPGATHGKTERGGEKKKRAEKRRKKKRKEKS